MLIIYHFLLDPRIGGPHVYVETLKRALPPHFAAVVLTAGKGPITDIALFNLRHIWRPLYLLEVLFNVMLILALVVRGKILVRQAIFHVHSGANIAPLLAARLLRIPVLWHMHETTQTFRKMVHVGRWLLTGANYRLASVARKANEVYGLPDALLLPGAVDERFWSRESVEDEERFAVQWCEPPSAGGARPMRLVTVGNLNPLKGIDLLLCALQSSSRPYHLKVVGADLATHSEYAHMLKALAEELNRSSFGQVEFVGWKDKREVRALLASCDAFVLPSRSEACPLSLLEALSVGCRCIATDVGDVRHMMEASPHSIVVSADSAHHLSQALNSLDTSMQLGRQNDQVPPSWRLRQTADHMARVYLELQISHGH